MYRLGIDIGGTFTDFTLVDETTGSLQLDKELTTPDNPAEGALLGAERLLSDNNATFEDLETIIHGTTLVSNTIIERTGAKTGLISTRGTKDILEIRRGWRYDIDDWQITYPDPLVPRNRRVEVNERLNPDGDVVEPLDYERAEEVVTELVEDHAVESIAVSLLHSYASGEHEVTIQNIINQKYPEVHVSLSSEVSNIIREYERTSTTVINAYAMPIIREYLDYLKSELRADGFAGELYMMTSNGGVLDVETTKKEPIRLVESGPAAGVLASRLFAEHADRNQVFAFDMGGTTAKGALIQDGTIPMTYETDIAREHRFKKGSGYTLATPMIELTEIGAGGGSIADCNDVDLIEVGPESSGANPGPVCYNKGGEEPTITDGLLLLGFLDPNTFFGGRMELAQEKAERILEKKLADPTGTPVTVAAWSAYEIVCENMASAFQQHASSEGADPREQTMVATGGAGPSHAYRVAEKVGIDEIICPRGAGVASSVGLIMAPRSYELTSTNQAPLETLDPADFEGEFRELYENASQVLERAGVDKDALNVDLSLDMRHIDQGKEIKIKLPDIEYDEITPELAREQFRATYQKRFGRDILDLPIEVISYRVNLREDKQPMDFDQTKSETNADTERSRKVYFGRSEGHVEAAIHWWSDLSVGQALSPPAIVEGDHTTVVIGPEWGASIIEGQHIHMERK